MTIPSNINFELLGVLVLLFLTPALMMTRTLRVSILSHTKMSTGCYMDCCSCDNSRVRLALLHRQKCVYIPNALYYYMKQGVFFIVCSRLSAPHWPLKNRRLGHFKGVLVLVIYHLVALVELLAAILRVRTQERACGPKGNTRAYKKLWALPNKGWGKKWITHM